MNEDTNENGAVETAPMTTTAILDVRDASTAGLALMRERVENQKAMLKIALSLTSPNQWTVFAGTDKGGVYRETVYPTGGAADTILRRAFGLNWGEKTITVEDTPDGRMATCGAWLLRHGEPLEHFTGYRFMGGYIKNEADLRKGALENLKSVAVRDLLGLRFRTPAELKELGLDINKLPRRAEFQSHDADPGELTVPFGREKGKPITDVSDENLDWLIGAVSNSVKDPGKAKWRAKNQQMLTALNAELEKRTGGEEKPVSPVASMSAADAIARIEKAPDSIGDDGSAGIAEVVAHDTRKTVVEAAQKKLDAIEKHRAAAVEAADQIAPHLPDFDSEEEPPPPGEPAAGQSRLNGRGF